MLSSLLKYSPLRDLSAIGSMKLDVPGVPSRSNFDGRLNYRITVAANQVLL